MIKKLTLSLIVGSLIPLSFSAQTKKDLTFDDIFSRNTFMMKSVSGFNSMKNDDYFTTVALNKNNSTQEIVLKKQHIKNAQDISEVINVTQIMSSINPEATFENYYFNHDESQLLLQFDGESIYRHSTKYTTYLYDFSSGSMTLIDSEPILHATFSPDGKKIAFVKDNNLYIYDIKNKTTHAITQDGRWNHIINGNCDWVYEEEFSFTQAYQWSPDSKYIAYYKFDESQVKEYTMALYGDLYPEQYTFKYPKAGEDNSIVTLHMYSVDNNNSYALQVDSNPDIYIPRIMWANEKELLILKLNRLQNQLQYITHHVDNKKNTVELTENNDYYVDILDPIIFYNNGQNMVYLSEKSGYVHIHDFNRKTGKDMDLTPFKYDVLKTLGYNTQNQMIYYLASPHNAMNNGIYAVSVKNQKNIVIEEKEGWYNVTAFPSSTKFLVNHSSVTSAPSFKIIDHKGQTIKLLEDNTAGHNKRAEYNFGQVKFIQLLAADNNTPLNGYIILPHNFDPNQQYPVLMYQYSGPGSQEVKNAYNLGHGLWHHYLTTKGYIIACFDGRGTGNRGEHFKKMTYLQLGKYESEDQIAIARQLGEMPFVNKDRIGIWGWSFGGFNSALCIFKGHDVFKAAISVAPVTHWALYDNIYTERFMRKPQDNPDGYNENAPLTHADKLKGKFLLIHGTADDNVHFQNSVMLTDALIRNNKQFDNAYYPNGNHGIGGGVIRAQLYKKMTDFILENL